jgi:uncharacterized membrane protein YfcA
MLNQRHVKILSRIFALLMITLGGFWLFSSWHFQSSQDTEILVLLLLVLLCLHLIGAFAGFLSGVGGIFGMIVFTVLSLFAPSFLNIPFRPGYYLNFLYFVFISAQIVLFILCIVVRSRSVPMNRSLSK